MLLAWAEARRDAVDAAAAAAAAERGIAGGAAEDAILAAALARIGALADALAALALRAATSWAVKVRLFYFMICTVTLHTNPSHNLTRSPSYIWLMSRVIQSLLFALLTRCVRLETPRSAAMRALLLASPALLDEVAALRRSELPPPDAIPPQTPLDIRTDLVGAVPIRLALAGSAAAGSSAIGSASDATPLHMSGEIEVGANSSKTLRIVVHLDVSLPADATITVALHDHSRPREGEERCSTSSGVSQSSSAGNQFAFECTPLCEFLFLFLFLIIILLFHLV